MNLISLMSLFGMFQGSSEASQTQIEIRKTLIKIWYVGSLSKSFKTLG